MGLLKSVPEIHVCVAGALCNKKECNFLTVMDRNARAYAWSKFGLKEQSTVINKGLHESGYMKAGLMKVSTHPALNSSRGVIRCREEAGVTETDIRDELSEQGVASVKSASINDQGQGKETDNSFLKFCNFSLPKDIHIGYLRVRVDPFVLNSSRCFKCQKCGHGAHRCSSVP